MRETTERGFLVSTLLLATTTAVLGVAVGFLPLLAARLGLDPLVGAGAVALLALCSTALQPLVGGLRDRGRLTTRGGATAGLALGAAGLVLLAAAPGAVTLFAAAAAFGALTGSVTPLAFAHLAQSTPEERMGRTMGTAELGRELGDVGGPLLVGAVAAASTLPVGLAVLAAVGVASGVVSWVALRPRSE
ncbi:MFS transporter [Microbacterium indicum]|uniref:MFS transporter n=1 Tax=Microbacterium indicum TaxID=358100 RepID=UPI00041F60E1